MIPVLFLDIDGTVREGLNDALGRYPDGVDDIRVFPDAVDRMRRWKDAGGRIVGVSNQGGIAKGYRTAEQVVLEMVETERQCDGLFDVIRWCPHHPDVAPCACRKPSTGLVIGATKSIGLSWPPDVALFVGDRETDRECAVRLGVDFMEAVEWRG